MFKPKLKKIPQTFIFRKKGRLWQRLLALAIGSMVLAVLAPSVVQAQSPTLESLSTKTAHLELAIDTVWVLLAGVLVFFMQTGFAMLEAGLLPQRSVVNVLVENFVDAGVTAIVFWAVGFGIGFGTSYGGLIGTDQFFLNGAIDFSSNYSGGVGYPSGLNGSSLNTFTLFFFQFAFAATASTITSGGMAGRTDFVGDLIYSAVMGAFSYPIVAHWVWNSNGWLAKLGYHDFAGSSVIHTLGGVTALVGAYLLGPRSNRDSWDELPPAHNLALATLGTMILWFGWYGFNPGSTLGTGNTGLIGLVTVNTTLAASAGAMTSLLFFFFRTGKWELSYCLNGSLAGLVGITAGCAYVATWAAVLIGLTGGVLVVVSMDIINKAKIDDSVSAFPVHGVCGMMGTLAVGFLAQPQLTTNSKAGLFLGGGFDLLGTQLLGLTSIVVFTFAFSMLMFGTLKAMGRLRMDPRGDEIGIDPYLHGASVWPDVFPIEEGQGTERDRGRSSARTRSSEK